MKSFLALVLISAAMVGCNTEPTSSNNPQDRGASIQGAAVQYKDVGLYGTFWNPCCEEWVSIAGTGHWVDRGDGDTHMNCNNFVGTGSNGGSYTQQGGSTQNTGQDGDATEPGYTYTLQFKFISDPTGCSFKLKVTYQFHYNAAGVLMAEVINSETTCLDE